MSRQKGQAVIEAVVMSLAFLSFVTLIMTIFYIGVIYTNLRFTSHEFLICPEYQNAQICMRSFQRSLRQIVRFGEIQNMNFQSTSTKRSLQFHLNLRLMNLHQLNLYYEDQIKLPLTAN